MLYRFGEKKILHYLKDAAAKMQYLFSLSLKDARKEINKNSEAYPEMIPYITNCVFMGLQMKEGMKPADN